MSDTVIVIRSLVPGGVADKDRRVFPGDRLVYVNEVNLANASLDAAVQALKGAPFGPVRLGISKPLQQEGESEERMREKTTLAAHQEQQSSTSEVRGRKCNQFSTSACPSASAAFFRAFYRYLEQMIIEARSDNEGRRNRRESPS